MRSSTEVMEPFAPSFRRDNMMSKPVLHILPSRLYPPGHIKWICAGKRRSISLSAPRISTRIRFVLQVAAQGVGTHTFTARVNNLELVGPGTSRPTLNDRNKSEITWHARVIDSTSPWVAVVLPDGQLNQHQELTGIVPGK